MLRLHADLSDAEGISNEKLEQQAGSRHPRDGKAGDLRADALGN